MSAPATDQPSGRAAASARWPAVRRLVARTAQFLAVVIACYIGGVAATNLSPTVVTAGHYQAVLRLDPVPRTNPVLHIPTIAGDVNLTFDAPVAAPGVDVQVSVREDITSLISSGNVSVSALQPSDEDVRAAITAASQGLGWRFGLGALAVSVALSAAAHVSRRRVPQLRHYRNAVAALVLVTAATAGGIATSYQPARFSAYRATGLLGTVARNADLLADLEARSAQVAPYLRNLLAVSAAIQNKFVPQEVAQPAALRLLLVSDIHGTNAYPFMKQLVADEDIDAVIDAGDIVNLGRPQELDAAQLRQGIESLGVPYVFVTGNHDQSSATDKTVARALASVPNVRLLQLPDGTFREVSIGGLRIAGLNDARWFGDDNQNFEAKLAPSVEAFNAAWQGNEPPDITVMHEPYLIDRLAVGRLRVNGHMHRPDLDGTRIQLGTFTGGGLLSHYTFPDEAGAELSGQPYSFSIATFGSSCALTQLTQYEFNGLLEGNPTYDNVSVINGRSVDPLAAQSSSQADTAPDAAQPRSCGRNLPESVRVVTPRTDAGEGGGDSATDRPQATATP